MARLDRQFADYRARAMAQPLTLANRLVPAEIELPGGLAIGLSANK
jgi:hypothetical protein